MINLYNEENVGNNTSKNEKYSGGAIMNLKRKSWFSRNKASIIVCISALLMGLTSFMITVKVYDNKIAREKQNSIDINKVVSNLSGEKNNYNVIAKVDEESKPTNEVMSHGGESTTEEFLGEDEISVVEISEDEYNEFVDLLVVNNEEKNDDNIIETIANVEKESGEKEEEKILKFIMPLSGDIGMNYATEKLIYSNTLDEWITHNGIDILGEEAEPVKAIESGVVESVKMDPRYGNTIIIKHNDEYKSVYSNLSTTDLVYVGKEIEKGDIISGVGIGFGFESKEKPHVHLTILKNSESVNPEDLM